MALELCRRENIEPLTAFRHVHGWSQEEATEAYNARLGLHVGDSGHLTRQRLGKLENWPSSGATPALTELIGLASLYHTSPRCLLNPDAVGKLPPTHQAAVTAGLEPPVPRGPRADGPVRSHAPLGDVEPVTVSHQSSAFLATWQSSGLGFQTLDQIRLDLTELTHDYMLRPSKQVFEELVLIRNRLFDLLSTRRCVGDMRRLLASAVLGLTLLARVTDDLGHTRAAERHAQTAWVLAGEVGDSQLTAWILATQSSLACWRSAPRHAIDLADQGLRTARGPFAARLQALRARAWVQLGDVQAATDDLRAADDTRPDPGTDEADLSGGVLSFPPALRHYLASTTYLWLGDAETAEREALAAVTGRGPDGRPELFVGDLALARIGLTRSRLMGPRRDVEAAHDALAPVLALPADLQIAALEPAVAEIDGMISDAGMRGSPTVRALHEAIRQFLGPGVLAGRS